MSKILHAAVGSTLTCAPLLAAAHHAEGYATPATPLAAVLAGVAHPAIEIGQLAFLLALGVLGAAWPAGARLAVRFGVGSAIGAAMAGAGWVAPVEPLLPLLLVAIAAVLARRDGDAGAPTGGLAALGGLLAAGFVHGQVAIEPMAGAAAGPFVAYAAGMLAAQCAIVLATRAAVAGLAPGATRPRRLGRGAAAAAAGLAAVAVALQPGLSLV